MARTSRTRARDLSFSGVGVMVTRFGSHTGTVLSTTNYGPYRTGYESTSDSVGMPWTDSPFNAKKGRLRTAYASGLFVQSPRYYQLSAVPLSSTASFGMSEPWLFYNQSAIPSPTLANMAKANANPNRPKIDLPVSLVELRDVPGTIRTIGRAFFRRNPGIGSVRQAADVNLATQFGALPFIRDFMTMLGITEAIAKREEYLRQLSQEAGYRLRRKLTSESWVVSDLYNAVYPAGPLPNGIQLRLSGLATRDYWYSARAKLEFGYSEREIKTLAAHATLGVQGLSFAHAWELMPWSWLIDWFSDTGSIIAANRGGIPWTFSGLNVMHKTTWRLEGTFVGKPPGITISPNTATSVATQKVRLQPVGWLLPTFRMPYLTAGQLSILTSLIAKTRS